MFLNPELLILIDLLLLQQLYMALFPPAIKPMKSLGLTPNVGGISAASTTPVFH